MLRLISLFILTFAVQNPMLSAQEIAGHWQSSDGTEVILTEEGMTKIVNTNGVFYGKWGTDHQEITLNLFLEYEPYTCAISDFFEDLTYVGKGHIPEDELAIYRNGYQLDPLPAENDAEPTGTVSLDTKWLVAPQRVEGAHVGTWQLEDGTQLDLSNWGAFRVFSNNKETSYGLFEIDGDVIRLQFLFHDGIYEYDLASVIDYQFMGASTLQSAEFQQAEQQMYNQLLSQVQSTNLSMAKMSSQMLEQMHQTTMKMIINLSGSDWMYEDEKY